MVPLETGAIRQALCRITIATRARHVHDVSDEVDRWLAEIGAGEGLLTAFVRHTSCSLTVQENADPSVLADLLDALDRLAPAGAGYRHGSEGPDDMPAHIKTMLTGASIAIPVVGGQMDFGTWQALYLIEHRARGRPRTITLHYLGS
ncbi:secondary thiamine-phosphate synthase enzyme YjbQ [Amorphus orientalis]|uniref:Secondary thiamine-phosphate synthase enzyme n=1 Tax=Amorphus orientalis TaxID=649198 RepID=A0AAE4ATU2_9HYPH|nr:secondary thiamine-phosphate synthase enzyme YjbQ [Amorphus orientalis]MDQ0315299.1 secondary thiamine-phosphate synthase enzyme [Amorphus orientalis]